MKKNNPHRSPESLRKATVRPDRIISQRPDRKHGRIEAVARNNSKAGLRSRITVATAIVLLLVILPLSCSLLSDRDDTDTANLTGLAQKQKTSDSAAESDTDISPSAVVTVEDHPAEKTEEAADTKNTESAETSVDTTETITVPSYKQANSSLLPELPVFSSEEIEGLSSVIYAWSFSRPPERDKHLPAVINDEAQKLIEPYTVIWQLPKSDKPTVYLTVDEGYEYADNTARILDIALEKETGICFFITGDFIARHPKLVMRMENEGHQVGNHTVNHASLAKIQQEKGREAVLAEILELEETYAQLTGEKMERFVRPPMGEFSPQVLAILNNEGIVPVFWSFAYNDWHIDNQPVSSAALDQILGELHDGSVILLHAVSKTNVEILPDLIDGIRERGYEIALLPFA